MERSFGTFQRSLLFPFPVDPAQVQARFEFGVLLIIAPLAGAVVLTWWLGAYALVFGVALVVLAFQLRTRRNESPRRAALQGA